MLEEFNHLILLLAQLTRLIPFLHLTWSVLRQIPLELLSEIFFVGGMTVISKMDEPKNLAIKCIFINFSFDFLTQSYDHAIWCLICTIEQYDSIHMYDIIWKLFTLCNISLSKLYFRRRIGEILGEDTYHTLYYNRGIDGLQRIYPMFAD